MLDQLQRGLSELPGTPSTSRVAGGWDRCLLPLTSAPVSHTIRRLTGDRKGGSCDGASEAPESLSASVVDGRWIRQHVTPRDPRAPPAMPPSPARSSPQPVARRTAALAGRRLPLQDAGDPHQPIADGGDLCPHLGWVRVRLASDHIAYRVPYSHP